MRKVAGILVLASAIAAAAGLAWSAEQFGVPVYPGAGSDAATESYCTSFNQESVQQARGKQESQAQCFRTSDSFRQVVSFYQHERTVMPLGQPIDKGLQKSALFCLQGMRSASLGNGVDVMVSTPWSDGAQQYSDVIISIRKATKR